MLTKQQNDSLLEKFKKTQTFKYFYSTLLRFDESLNCFVATEKWRDKEAELLTAAWWMFAEVTENQVVYKGFEQAYSEIFSPIIKQPYPRLENSDYKYIEIDQGWKLWQAAKAIPEGFVLVPVKEIKEWYLDDSENIYREDPYWLCDVPIGEVLEVEHRVSYELDQDPVFAAIQWDEVNGDIGYYETFKSKEEAEKVAAHCKAMKESQESSHAN
ncbi:hypothetical protein [Acinetobacter sp.]|uniref:hypothetical protein n=1 Tax=Acinetobacter sp. TaxID=472 RepID=UPI0028AD96DE|nr:hypothetical protein [Acinetobacter sp.]